MIQINDCEIKYKWSGLFMTDEVWTHPKICEDTYEIIYVTSGDVYIKEDGKEYHLTRGNLIILKPGEHEGSQKSYGKRVCQVNCVSFLLKLNFFAKTSVYAAKAA